MSDQQATPTLEGLLRMAVKDQLFDLCTGIPGVVESFDPAKGTINAKPALMRHYGGETDVALEMPIINSVPVMWPSSGKARITFPLAKGDPVWLMFSHRSIEIWKAKGGVVDPQDPRIMNISDAVAYPGTRSPADPVPGVAPDALRVEFGGSVFQLKDGTFTLKGASDELLDVLIQITTKLSLIAEKLGTTTTNTLLGPQTLLAAPDFTAAKADIDALKAKLSTLKG